MIDLKANKGFLLFEVLVTVIILSVGLVLIIEAFLGSLRAASVSSNMFKAELLLEDRLFEHEVAGEIPPGRGDGKFFEEKIREFRWKEISEPIQTDHDWKIIHTKPNKIRSNRR